MDLLTTARSPWGESIFTHISWSLFWASLVGGLLFLLAHGGYMLFSQHRKRPSEEVDRLERERGGLPAHITRHGFVARAFHWVMAVSMLTLLVTGVPADRRRAVRVGAVALDGRRAADRVDPVPHRSTPRSSWTSGRSGSGRRTSPSSRRRCCARWARKTRPDRGPASIRSATASITSRSMVAGLVVIATGIMMMWRVRTGLVERNPYVLLGCRRGA